ncbi:MAG: hypothetical protein ACI36Y_09150 [Coriobacteriales bacterium]
MTLDIKAFTDGLAPEELAAYTAAVMKAGSAEEVVAFAKEKGRELQLEDAQALVEKVKARASEEISLDELDNVAGGCHDYPCHTYGC